MNEKWRRNYLATRLASVRKAKDERKVMRAWRMVSTRESEREEAVIAQREIEPIGSDCLIGQRRGMGRKNAERNKQGGENICSAVP